MFGNIEMLPLVAFKGWVAYYAFSYVDNNITQQHIISKVKKISFQNNVQCLICRNVLLLSKVP